MVVLVVDNVTGTPVYLNPRYVVTVRPDPNDPDHISQIKLQGGESLPRARRPPTSSRQAACCHLTDFNRLRETCRFNRQLAAER